MIDSVLLGAFKIRTGDVVSLVGGGGKTTLMFALGDEIASIGKKVITTSTTRIWPPLEKENHFIVVESNPKTLINKVNSGLKLYKHLTVVRAKLESGKFQGISPETVDDLARIPELTVIVEADGSAQRPLKAPRDNEPVIPETSTLVIPVIGGEVIGRTLTEDNVFRASIAARILNVSPGSQITLEMAATLLTDSSGIYKGTPSRANIIPLINKMDLIKGKNIGKKLAHLILSQDSRISRVVLGQLKNANQIWGIVER